MRDPVGLRDFLVRKGLPADRVATIVREFEILFTMDALGADATSGNPEEAFRKLSQFFLHHDLSLDDFLGEPNPDDGWARAVEALSRLLGEHGVVNTLDGTDFWIVEDQYEATDITLEVISPDKLTPSLRTLLLRFVQDHPPLNRLVLRFPTTTDPDEVVSSRPKESEA